MKRRRNIEAISRKRYGWGTLYLKMDLTQASSPIRYSIDGPGDWRSTPFQTASARHNKAKAFALVNRWLRGQNPTLPVGRLVKVRAKRLRNGRIEIYQA